VLLLSALAGEVALAIGFAVSIFLVPHGLDYAREDGSFVAFLYFTAFFSIYYAVEFVCVALPCCFILRRWPLKFWPRCLLGAVLFAMGGIALISLRHSPDGGDSTELAIQFAGLMAAAGFGAFIPFR